MCSLWHGNLQVRKKYFIGLLLAVVKSAAKMRNNKNSYWNEKQKKQAQAKLYFVV